MVCSVCQGKVDRCASGACGEVLRDRFYCFGGIHFCSRSCWKVWFLSGEEEKLMLAKKAKRVKKIKPIEVKKGTPKSRRIVMYDSKCANCGVHPELGEKIIAGGCLEEGEWVCSDKCYNGYEVWKNGHLDVEEKRAQEGIRK